MTPRLNASDVARRNGAGGCYLPTTRKTFTAFELAPAAYTFLPSGLTATARANARQSQGPPCCRSRKESAPEPTLRSKAAMALSCVLAYLAYLLGYGTLSGAITGVTFTLIGFAPAIRDFLARRREGGDAEPPE